MSPGARRRLTRALVLALIAAGLVAINGPTVASTAEDALHDYKINSSSYKERNGHWSILGVPDGFRVNAIHAAMLRTGKVLIIAGSGNDRKDFDAKTFKTLIWDPKTDKFKLVHTPSDVFCAGHIFLPDGKLLIAGGTKRYEKLDADITHAAGVMTVKNEDPDGRPRLDAGQGNPLRVRRTARPTAPRRAVTVKPAAKRGRPGRGHHHGQLHPGLGRGRREGPQLGRQGGFQLHRRGPHAAPEAQRLRRRRRRSPAPNRSTGATTSPTSSIRRPSATRRSATSSSRAGTPRSSGSRAGACSPSRGSTSSGASSGATTSSMTPRRSGGRRRPQLKRTFPTYPSLFLMPSGNLFYTGSNAGYGSDTVGRDPGIWNLEDNSFRKVPGLRDPTQTETSGSVLLPPAQDQRYMIAGGGGVGESKKSTARTDVIDLKQANPRFTPGPDLDEPTRYPNMVITPDDRVVITGGSRGYRGEGDSDTLICNLYDPQGTRLTRVADPTVGPQLPLAGAAAARRASDHARQRPALPGRRQHQARRL